MSTFARTVRLVLLGFGVLAAVEARADDPPANAKIENAKARLEAVRKVYKDLEERWKIDVNTHLDPEKPYQWSRRWMEAEQDLSSKKADQIAAAEAHLERMKKSEETIKLAEKAGFVLKAEVAAQNFFRLEAERTLANLKDK